MKTILFFAFVLSASICFGQASKEIKFAGKTYGYIRGADSSRDGYMRKGHYYKDGIMTFYIGLSENLSDSQYTQLEDSLRQSVLKRKRDAYVGFRYFNQADDNAKYDVTSPGYLLQQSGHLRNITLALGLVSSPLVYAMVLANPAIGLIVGTGIGVLLIVEEVRANNMLIKAGNKMMFDQSGQSHKLSK